MTHPAACVQSRSDHATAHNLDFIARAADSCILWDPYVCFSTLLSLVKDATTNTRLFSVHIQFVLQWREKNSTCAAKVFTEEHAKLKHNTFNKIKKWAVRKETKNKKMASKSVSCYINVVKKQGATSFRLSHLSTP